MKAIQSAIDEYYQKAFSPEIIQALQFVQESTLTAELISKYTNLGAGEKDTFTASESRFQANLFYIQRSFETALKQIRLKSNHILFIDGIDIRPATIPYSNYLECIRGLANAVWEVNNDIFPAAKGSGVRMRTVLLVRPDIFASLGLQNLNTKIRDNAVFLDWRTDYTTRGHPISLESLTICSPTSRQIKLLKGKRGIIISHGTRHRRIPNIRINPHLSVSSGSLIIDQEIL